MRTIDSTLVDIARDFLEAHQALRALAARHRSGELHFDEVLALVGDDEESVLFRLKERCHRVFRAQAGPAEEIGPGALFDLAVGSLFHEAMKFRENVYTRDVYGPRVQALRDADVPDEAGLLRESQKIIEDSGMRLEESLMEAEILLKQTVGQFRVLLRMNASNAFVTRFLIEHRGLVQQVLGEGISAVLDAIHGDASKGFAAASQSYLSSGFYQPAREAIREAEELGYPKASCDRIAAYADGMNAYLEGRYSEFLEGLQAWSETPFQEGEERLRRLAVTALSRLGQLVGEGGDPSLGERASVLADQISQQA